MKRMMALCGLLVLALAAAAGTEEASKQDLKQLQGKWKVVSQVRDGKSLEVSTSLWDFTDNKNLYPNGSYDLIKLDTAKKPKALDFDHIDPQEDKHSIKGLKGIYEIEGDTLKMCVAYTPGKDRPKAFESKEKSGHTLTILKRVKEAKTSPK